MKLFQRISISIVIGSMLLCGNAVSKPPDDVPPIEVDVNVVNTPDVNVVNTPLEAIIVNEPLLVEDVDSAARQVVFATKTLTISDGDGFSDKEVLFSVPDGKRLVIEHINVLANTDENDLKRIVVTLELGNLSNSARFAVPVAELPSHIGSNVNVLNQLIKLYSEPEVDIEVRASRGPDTNGADSIFVRIWGHLIDVPE